MFTTIFTVIISAVSIYYFYQSNFFLGILFLVWAISIKFGNQLQRLLEGLGKLTKHSDLERKCNVFIEIGISIDEALKHPSLDDLFRKLKENKIVHEAEQSIWINKLIDNYKNKYKSEGSYEKIKFNIKNNLVWKNEKIDFLDSIYHEIFIPYDIAKEEIRRSVLTPEIEIGLKIRIFIVNGIIKLQIGEFGKKYSPTMLREGFLAVYQTYVTITSFPLIYFPYETKIPETYLNLSYKATESYMNHYSDKKINAKEWNTDWKRLNEEIKIYNYLCETADEPMDDEKKWRKIMKSLNEKQSQWLVKEGFNDPNKVKDDSYDPWRDNNIYNSNKYLSIFVKNFNEIREERLKTLYTDYYEERPF